MKRKRIYQTLEDRGNPDYIEQNAPFKCNRRNAWLGEGYYFWDTFIENAHWWGIRNYGDNYVICEGTCLFDMEKCFDLVGNTEHLLEFGEAIEFLKKQNLVNENTTVSRILNFMQSLPGFKYEAIRASGINTISQHKNVNQEFIYRIRFDKKMPQYLDYKPPIQICIFKKSSLELSKMKIVFPDEYIQDLYI